MRYSKLGMHRQLDLIVAAFISDTGKLISRTPIMALVEWSWERVKEEKAKQALEEAKERRRKGDGNNGL